MEVDDEAGAEDPHALAATLNDTAALLHAKTAAARLIDDATVGARA